MSLKTKLEAGQAVVGAFLGLRSPDAAELMSQAGYDFLLVDAEHSNIGPDGVLEMLRAIDRGRAAPLVRLSETSASHVQWALDGGAETEKDDVMTLLHISGARRHRLLGDTLKGCIQGIVRGKLRIDVARKQFQFSRSCFNPGEAQPGVIEEVLDEPGSRKPQIGQLAVTRDASDFLDHVLPTAQKNVFIITHQVALGRH